MGSIMTRAAVGKIMADENLSPEQRTEQIMSLYGRALDDGYISKTAAQTAQETALTNARSEWEKSLEKPNIKESDDYKALLGEFDSYKTMQKARTSDDFKEVKPKFFETVYGMVNREEGAESVKDQLSKIRENYEEYFTAQETAPKPQFGSPDRGTMPKGDEGATTQMTKLWGFGK